MGKKFEEKHGIQFCRKRAGEVKCRCGRKIDFKFDVREENKGGTLEIMTRTCKCHENPVCFYCQKPVNIHSCGNIALVA